ncbi:uncharacterized protein LAJ45_06272 [Morchella importuna]|uniref:Diphthamide biosynthesis protein 4 n=1 Tax=Morchella conica CCBAS932 TaxID=1392247 RepID=A0A3N4L4U9_9PEZI|nr:uncharacterized protein LAJ45_06272 [Morchella importuna]KAH8149641.1 hypothetical protein LAJ45_06272 [Morchella importuna]RPB17586.1 DnaJ-domain-containing protein [Morchella conica CCBAS932]
MTRLQTHYDILSLPPTTPSTPLTPNILKKAYHRALLLHHPDKTLSPSTKAEFTVDQITTAYNVLSTPHLRAEYDKKLGAMNEETGDDGKVLQVVDLDDFIEREEGRWTKSCRCGEEEGYVVTEEDLEAGDDVVGCCGCSLWLKVGYEILEDEDENVTGQK